LISVKTAQTCSLVWD